MNQKFVITFVAFMAFAAMLCVAGSSKGPSEGPVEEPQEDFEDDLDGEPEDDFEEEVYETYGDGGNSTAEAEAEVEVEQPTIHVPRVNYTDVESA